MQDTLVERPLGITILAYLLMFQGIVEVITGFVALALLFWTQGVVLLLSGIITFFLSWGLWTLKRWAFWVILALAIIHLVGSIMGLVAPATHFWIFGFGIIMPIVILIYFLANPRVRAAFRAEH